MPTFGEQLRRLAEIRGLRLSGPDAGLASVLDGAVPSPAQLIRLASVLGLHRSDLFVVAGLPVPEDLAPRDAAAGDALQTLAWPLVFVPGAVPELHRLVRSLPRLARPPGPAPVERSYPDGPAGLVLRLLHNRNLDWASIALYLRGLGGGPMLAVSSIRRIGHGARPLTPDLLAAFGAVLDLSSVDLSALTGIDLRSINTRAHPDADEAAELIWSARALTAAQLSVVVNRAQELRQEWAGESRA
ncbi:XRE family transcriptional regulator [Cryptosporangium phraense]|uniref:XRE family transcriptional regulator n=1 Tax=Cryptosporangium phraense TaxID=2593070 RepID=A0A545ATQ9_9ACTN|nr:XRE family transcriptional regulator [Cryptosporangium phraense]TQS43985.1 XRE family transcriptional regulator [Cryptosporangium phraense]